MTEEPRGIVRLELEVDLTPGGAFRTFVADLASALGRRDIRFAAAAGGEVTEGDTVVGRVVSWEPGERVRIEWRPHGWDPGVVTEVEVRVEAAGEGARLSVEHRGPAEATGPEGELVGWFASEVAAPALAAMAPVALGDWITDRQARRPSGDRSRAIYRDPLYHYPNFRVLLAELGLGPPDHLLEVACGGGAFLKMALESGCTAAGVDYSPDMVQVAREENADAIAGGRLEIVEGRAEALPFPDATFSCAAMTGVLGFLPDPVAALREIHRVLRPGGRIVVMGSDPENRGTPAAPEPMASRLRFYEEEELEELGRAAGFASVEAVRRELEQHAREVGIPEEVVPLFAGPGARFLLAGKE